MEEDRGGAPDGDHVVAFAVERAIFESVSKERKPMCFAAMSGEVDVRFDTSDVESCLSSRHAKESRRASYIQKPSTVRAADLYNPPHPPTALLDTDSVISKIVHISGGMAETLTPKIVLATVERTDGRLGETRILEHQRAIRASVPAQPA